MNCKKCGKTMPNGARFCISCGAEHDANGQLVGGSQGKVDYNKTVMANDAFMQSGGGAKVDYNKTVMANDAFMQSSRPKADYNKTMMANDVPQVNPSQNQYNQKNNVNQNKNTSANSKQVKKNKKVSPVLIIVLILLVVAVAFKVVLPMLKKKQEPVISESANIESSATEQVVEETGNVVADFDSSDGYWSKDAEFFYKDGTIQKNQWKGDFYLGPDGRKVRNELIDDTYYVDANGQKLKNQWYRFTKKINGKEVVVWYYMGSDGAKLRDTFTPDGYYVDSDGVYIPGELNNTPDSDRYVPSN